MPSSFVIVNTDYPAAGGIPLWREIFYDMPDNYEKLFARLKSPEPSVNLFAKIISRVRREQRFLTLRKVIIFSIGFIGSGAAFVPVLQAVLASFTESGFAEFFSLLFSDAEAVIAHWQSFVLSLLESFPVMNTIAFLAIMFIFLESIKFLVRNARAIFNHTQIIAN